MHTSLRLLIESITSVNVTAGKVSCTKLPVRFWHKQIALAFKFIKKLTLVSRNSGQTTIRWLQKSPKNV